MLSTLIALAALGLAQGNTQLRGTITTDDVTLSRRLSQTASGQEDGGPTWIMNYSRGGEDGRGGFTANLKYTGLDDSKVYSIWAVTFDYGAENTCAGYCTPTDLDVFGGTCKTGMCRADTPGCNLRPTSKCGLRLFNVGGGVPQNGVFTHADDQGWISINEMVPGQESREFLTGSTDQQSQLVLGDFGGLSNNNDAIYIVLREHPAVNDVPPGSSDNNVCAASGWSISDDDCRRCMERRLPCGCGGVGGCNDVAISAVDPPQSDIKLAAVKEAETKDIYEAKLKAIKELQVTDTKEAKVLTDVYTRPKVLPDPDTRR
ncbi:unnamed protein product [Chrysoparadoxa australica]